MDKIAIISDIHGNLHALEAVLADIRARGIDLIYNLGDLVGKGPQSDLAVDISREVCQVTVRGNWDELIATPSERPLWPTTVWSQQQLGPERLAYLRSLPNIHDFWLSGKRVRLLHASSDSLYTRVFPHSPPDIHLAMFQATPFTGDAPAPDIVGYGDIHTSYMLALRNAHKLLFNAGSVGHPMDMPLASYAILTGQLDSQKPASFSVDFVRIPYDIDAVLAAAQRLAMPDYDAYAVELREAVYHGRQEQEED